MRNLILVPLFLPVLLISQAKRVYTIVMNNNHVGVYEVAPLSDRTFKEYYWMNDRGRGDSLHAVYKVNERFIVTELEVKGHDYFKNPVLETFSLKDGTAQWENDSEKESRKVEKEGLYIPLKNLGGDLISTLLANNNRIDLIPYGSAYLERVGEFTFKLDDKNIKCRLVAVKGVGSTPLYNWLDEQDILFASVSDWTNIIRKGYEPLQKELLAVQKAEDSKLFKKIKANAVESPLSILIKNVLLFDSKTGKSTPNAAVLIQNKKITKVSYKNIIAPKGAKVIDGKGMTLIPGLIDMHTHFGGELEGAEYIACGVTGIRDLGNNFEIVDKRKKLKNGEMIGPTIEVIAGLLDGKGPFAGPTPALAGSLFEALSWVDTFAAKGFQQVKLYSSIKPDWVESIVRKAKLLNLRVSGHIPAYMTAEQAVKYGYDEIQHMNMVFLNFYGDTIDTRSPNRFRIPAQKAATFDFNSPQLKAFLQLLKDKKTVIDPTVSIFRSMFKGRPGKMNEGYEPIVDRLPLDMQRYIRAGGGLPVPEGYDAIYHQSADAFLKMVKVLYDNNIPIVAGTDGWAGFDLHLEMENYVKAGIPAPSVLKIATLGNATVLNKQNEIGSIDIGKRANVVLIDGNPMQNISDIRKVKWVVRDGVLYNPAKILEGISIKNYDFKAQ